MKRLIKNTALSIGPGLLHLAGLPYWGLVRAIITFWDKRGMHPIRVGTLKSGPAKRRSLYREEMLLRAILLCVDIRGRSCLDLACNDGFWSFRLGWLGLETVTGIDECRESVARANMLKHLYAFPHFSFWCQDLFDFLHSGASQSYDIVLLLSILYHLPEDTDWSQFFHAISDLNNHALIIDSRWFDDDAYWYDTTSEQAIIETVEGIRKKWRPDRRTVRELLILSGYEQVIEIDPSLFLYDRTGASGDGDPYTLENVADYITGHRSLMVAYKQAGDVPVVANRLWCREGNDS